MLGRFTTIARRQIQSTNLALGDLSYGLSQNPLTHLRSLSTSTKSLGPKKASVSSFDRSTTYRSSSPRKFKPHQSFIEPFLYEPKSNKRKKMSRPAGVPFAARGSRGKRPQGGRGSFRGAAPKPRAPPLDVLPGPLHDEQYILATYNPNNITLKSNILDNPKSPLSNYVSGMTGENPVYEFSDGAVSPNETKKICRARVLADKERNIYGIGDAPTRKEAEKLAALSACIQLSVQGLLDRQKKPTDVATVLSDGTEVSHERARIFIDWYCRRFSFGKPEIICHQPNSRRPNPGWQATLMVKDRSIGVGTGPSKKVAQVQCYGDACKYLENCDRALWEGFMEWTKSKDASMVPPVYLQMSNALDDDIHSLCEDMQNSQLYANKPPPSTAPSNTTQSHSASGGGSKFSRKRQPMTDAYHEDKSSQFLEALRSYEVDPNLSTMRATRHSLPVMTRANELIEQIDKSDVSICMAATGSGKTTQIPQIILDDWIRKGKGSRCNIICTQPRRIAAISVAERVAKERGESTGASIGYQVRFEAKPPRDHGGVTFCTTGIFLKRMQSALQHSERSGSRSMDDVTHIIVDEVHERDVDTDLALVVLKRLLEDRRARGIPIKIVLMSATIDPTLFQKYFAEADGTPAPVIEIPGRLFPVEKKFLDGIIDDMEQKKEDPEYRRSRWVFKEKNVSEYLSRELGPTALAKFNAPPPLSRTASSSSLSTISVSASEEETHDELEMPYPLISLTIAHVLSRSDSGHVLVFLPGWDEIAAVQRLLEDRTRPLLDINFTDRSKYAIHLLHSTIPVAEQQAVFEPPPEGVRRIILATNIAETSITIPDVVYVVDTAKVKEIRYDPQRHMSSLVSAWVGKSNLNQRAGRGGRHRPGEYYGILPQSRADSLHTHQMVEMKRSDLSNVVMHVKALDFPGMGVEEVLAALIEPPAPDHVTAALANLKMVGALDEHQNLTSLGKVLQQLPLDVNLGRLLLLGSFFKCLDQALSLVAILSHRDPFMSPIQMKKEANAAKERWTPKDFRSDTLAVLFAYNEWASLHERKDPSASRFCMDNFLSKTTLLSIHKVRGHLLQALENAGVLAISAGGHGAPPLVGAARWARNNNSIKITNIPESLNTHGDDIPMLAALIAIASQPNFAIRTSDVLYRTSIEKHTFIHPSSVNHRKRPMVEKEGNRGEKQLYTFQEKSRNVSNVNTNPVVYLRNVTRLDPMTYMLFGAYQVEVTERGLDCDGWLPVTGFVDVLDDVQRLKTLMDACMLRVFEGICHWRKTHRHESATRSRAARCEEDREEETADDETETTTTAPRMETALSPAEIRELDKMTSRIVNILDRFAEERNQSHSRTSSRPVTPSSSRPGTPGVSRPGTPGGGSSPSMNYNLRLPGTYAPSRGYPSWSGYNTPLYGANTPYATSAYNSRPATPSGLGGPGRNSYYYS